ncbi:UNVERIFIED_CONTAM: hypothetical protein FKN15_018224 [Acipenser sinensis]
MDRNALAELLQALESRRDAEERRREERYTALIERGEEWAAQVSQDQASQGRPQKREIPAAAAKWDSIWDAILQAVMDNCWCPICGEQGHSPLNCPLLPEGCLLRPVPPVKGECLLVPPPPPPTARAEQQELSLSPPQPPAEGEFLLVPPPWEDCVSLPPPPAEGACLLVPSPSPPPAEGACLLVSRLQPEGEEPLPPLQPEGEDSLPPLQPEGEEPLPPS